MLSNRPPNRLTRPVQRPVRLSRQHVTRCLQLNRGVNDLPNPQSGECCLDSEQVSISMVLSCIYPSVVRHPQASQMQVARQQSQLNRHPALTLAYTRQSPRRDRSEQTGSPRNRSPFAGLHRRRSFNSFCLFVGPQARPLPGELIPQS